MFFTIPTNIPILGDLQISETMVVSWIVMAVIAVLCLWLTHDLKVTNISKRQAVAEFLVEKANNFVRGNTGGYKFDYKSDQSSWSSKPNGRSVNRSSMGSGCIYYDHGKEDPD